MPYSERKKAHQGTDALQRSPKVRHDDAPQSDRRRTDAPQSVHNLTKSKQKCFRRAVFRLSETFLFATNNNANKISFFLQFCGAWVYRQSELRRSGAYYMSCYSPCYIFKAKRPSMGISFALP